MQLPADRIREIFHHAYNHINSVFGTWASELCEENDTEKTDSVKQSYIQKFKDLLEADKTEKSLQVIWYEVNKDKEHEVFRNLNSRPLKR